MPLPRIWRARRRGCFARVNGEHFRRNQKQQKGWPLLAAKLLILSPFTSCPLLVVPTIFIAIFRGGICPTGDRMADAVAKLSTTDHHPSTTTLTFGSLEELQTRLILLPRVEEEGVGAVVQSFIAVDNDSKENEADSPDNDRFQGCVLETVVDETKSVSVLDMEFSSILAVMRDVSPPVHLKFSRTVDSNTTEPTEPSNDAKEGTDLVAVENKEASFEEEKKADPVDIDTADLRTAEKDHYKQVNVRTEEQGSSMQHSLMSWASRLSASSVQLAAEKAQQAMEAAAEHRKAAATVVANYRSPSGETKGNRPSHGLDMFIQTNSGAFLPLPREKQRPNSELRVTNSSLLMIRKSAVEACSSTAFSFQWYRSAERGHACEEKTSEWIELPGATSRTFQPTAAEVGHKIKCFVVKVDTEESDDETDDDGDHAAVASKPLTCSFETFECVAASLQLFNGARQALGNGAQFGGIKLQNNDKDQTLRIKVNRKISKDSDTKQSVSSTCFYQLSAGSELEPIHVEDEPILGIAALADHKNAKNFELVLPDEMPASASKIVELAEEGRLKLSAPNRLGRESLMLAIGIANYSGDPSSLEPTSVLFPDPPTERLEEASPEESESQSSSPVDAELESEQSSSVDRPPLIPKQNEVPSMDGHTLHCEGDLARIRELEKELSYMRSKTSKKDKSLVDLQKKLNVSETKVANLRDEISGKETELKESKKNLLVAERRMQSQEDDMKRMRSDHSRAVESLNRELDSRAATIAELEKSLRILQNEKAVLSATVEARDSKLTKMSELQSSLREMKVEVDKTNDLRDLLQKTSQKSEVLAKQLESATEREEFLRVELKECKEKTLRLQDKIQAEAKKTKSCRTELDTQQMKIQKLTAERNSYKQKSDSLSKEISKVCRHGRSIKEVEKIIADDSARRQEVELLREQKRKALEDLDFYRTSFEQSRAAQRLAGVDQETSKILERNAELERLLSELTEYVSAKEMQLDTLKAVNEALQAEIRESHRSQMSKNLGKNDV